MHMYESAQAVGAKEQKDAAMGTMSLFGDIEESVDFIPVPNVEDLSEDDKLRMKRNIQDFTLQAIHCKAMRRS